MKKNSLPILLSTLLVSLPVMTGAESTPVPTGAITLDGTDTGRIYDGIGALSAGASSRLLIDYPEPQRSEILDYLFKPNFGAALQINKVEIGGGMNSTDGSEPSHMRTETDENYRRGYEWWLMVESKKRNPNVKLYALEWGAPNWINPEKNDVWTDKNFTYILNWVRHAKSDYNLDIDYLGGWNERGYKTAWYKKFRAALNQAGMANVKVVCADSFNWDVSNMFGKDPDFQSSFEIIGMHYPGSVPRVNHTEAWKKCKDSGKALWGSEIGSKDYNTGAGELAKLYNQGYIGSRMTSYINWATIWSVLPGMPYAGDGLMLAAEPWSGHYKVGLSIWVTAHTTQFVQPGWQYMDHASALFLDGTSTNGSYVALKSPDGKDLSVIVETVDAKTPRTARFAVKGGLTTGPLHVWKTVMDPATPEGWFLKKADVTPVNGEFEMTFDPKCLYTISTVSTAHKGETTPPPHGNLALPYREDFQSYEIGSTPKYLSDQHGTFEVAPASGGRTGKCLRQMVTAKPVCWAPDGDPTTMIGDMSWANYKIRADFLMEQPGYVELIGRMTKTVDLNSMGGYHLQVTDQGHWSLRAVIKQKHEDKKTPPFADVVLAKGDLPSPIGTGKWHQFSLNFSGSKITATVDDQTLGEWNDSTYTHGLAGLVAGRWQTPEFMDLQVIPNTP